MTESSKAGAKPPSTGLRDRAAELLPLVYAIVHEAWHARLTALAEKATPGPWTYRPMQYDDWGMVRADDMAFVAGAHAGRHVSDAELDEHRRNKTDPFEHNGLFISACREGVPALCEALTDQRATIERLERERDEAKAISQGWELQAGEAEAEAREVVERVKATREKLVDYACHFGARDEVSKLFIAAALDHAEAVSVMLAAITAAPEVRG